MNHILETYKNELTNEVLNIYQDDYCTDPREDTNLTTMIFFHSRYNLGDDHNINADDFSGWDEMKAHLLKTEDLITIEPVYMYEHSGIALSTSPFSCRWDSGQIGFIYVSKASYIECCGNVDSHSLEMANAGIKHELGLYGDYIEGNVFYAELIGEDGLEIDSCGGFIGYDNLLINICDCFGLDDKLFNEA